MPPRPLARGAAADTTAMTQAAAEVVQQDAAPRASRPSVQGRTTVMRNKVRAGRRWMSTWEQGRARAGCLSSFAQARRGDGDTRAHRLLLHVDLASRGRLGTPARRHMARSFSSRSLMRSRMLHDPVAAISPFVVRCSREEQGKRMEKEKIIEKKRKWWDPHFGRGVEALRK